MSSSSLLSQPQHNRSEGQRDGGESVEKPWGVDPLHFLLDYTVVEDGQHHQVALPVFVQFRLLGQPVDDGRHLVEQLVDGLHDVFGPGAYLLVKFLELVLALLQEILVEDVDRTT